MSVLHRFQAWSDLWRRYREHFAFAWRQRAELTPPNLNQDEAEFLPAALSLQAKPVSPAGRYVALILILLVAVALVWAIFGKLDIVVVATGKIIPSGRTKTMASVEVASVSGLHVHEGQTVKKGDVLVELDPRTVNSEREKAGQDAILAALQAARARALITAINVDAPPRLASVPGVPIDRRREAEQHLEGQWLDYLAKRHRLDAEIRRYSGELPLAEERARDYADLLLSNDVSRHAYLEKVQATLELKGQLAEARNQREILIAETRKTAQDALAEAQRVLNDASQDAMRARAHGELLKLVAPIDGTVQQLAVHTVGGVVPAAQPLMLIVPEHGEVEIDAHLENKDVGFVREGQVVAVKIDAFDYTKYGTVAGRIVHVSRDAIEDEKKGLFYSARVKLDTDALMVEGQPVKLTPGMGVSVEIMTGTRRVIEYVLSPLIQHTRESLRER